MAKEKHILVTGVTSGIGHEIARQLCTRHRLTLVGRSEERLSKTRAELEAAGARALSIGLCDLSSQASIRAFAARFSAETERLDVLVNCAGIYNKKREESVDGIELVFATNVLGYHLLTVELLPLLERSAPSRVVVVASEFAGKLDLDDIPFKKHHYQGTAAYQRTKQANRMWTRALARRVAGKGVTVNAMAPGFVYTHLYDGAPTWQKPILRVVGATAGRTVEEGADTAVWLADSDEVEGESGGFWKERARHACEFEDEAAEERLWKLCEQLTAAS